MAGELELSAAGKFLGLLVGGDTPELKFEPAAFENTVRSLRAFAEKSGAKILRANHARWQA